VDHSFWRFAYRVVGSESTDVPGRPPTTVAG
jgi:hypothetical protein